MYKDNDMSVEANPLTDVSLVHPVGTLAQVIYCTYKYVGIAGAGSAGGNNNNDGGGAASTNNSSGDTSLQRMKELCFYVISSHTVIDEQDAND